MKTNELTIVGRAAEAQPKWNEMGALLDVVEAFFRDPEHEREYQEWIAERKQSREGA